MRFAFDQSTNSSLLPALRERGRVIFMIWLTRGSRSSRFEPRKRAAESLPRFFEIVGRLQHVG